MKATDAAWLAGIIDGEGSIILDRGLPGSVTLRPVVTVGSSTPVILKKIVKITGVGAVRPTRRKEERGKPMFHWSVSCSLASRALAPIIPYLVLKDRQARLALRVENRPRGRVSGGLTVRQRAQRQRWFLQMKEFNRHAR